MFQKKTMKWTTLLKDLREKVGLTQQQSFPSPSPSSSSSSFPSSSLTSSADNHNAASLSSSDYHHAYLSNSRDRHELESDFKRFWEEFRSSSSEKEKETALNMAVDAFCKLAKQLADVAQLVTMLVETHIFSFVVGRAFVTDIEKLKISNKARSLVVEEVLHFFAEVTKDGICPGANLLSAIELLISGPIDKQSLLDSGILCCLIHILNALLGSSGGNIGQRNSDHDKQLVSDHVDAGALQENHHAFG